MSCACGSTYKATQISHAHGQQSDRNSNVKLQIFFPQAFAKANDQILFIKSYNFREGSESTDFTQDNCAKGKDLMKLKKHLQFREQLTRVKLFMDLKLLRA